MKAYIEAEPGQFFGTMTEIESARHIVVLTNFKPRISYEGEVTLSFDGIRDYLKVRSVINQIERDKAFYQSLNETKEINSL